MKIILSRKGFDSSAGGHANPIYHDEVRKYCSHREYLDSLLKSEVGADTV